MTTKLGCIADDFTGATDLAGLLARSGHRVSLRIGVPQAPPTDAAAFEVVALKCRTAPVDAAVAECRAALAWLRAAGAERVFWKYCSTFDSTADGNIGPVAEALMADLGVSQTIYCPAFPENGRSVFMGHLFVGQAPLHESPMKDHPLTPMRDSNLMRLLAPQVRGAVGLIDRRTVARGPQEVRDALDARAKDGVSHVVVDAVADGDLHVIAEACHHMPLLTGGSAVAMPLPQFLMPAAQEHARSEDQGEQIGASAIVLSGSCSAMTRQQVAAYAASAPHFKLDPVVLANDGSAAAEHWLSTIPLSENPLIFATAEPDDVATAQERLGVETAGALVEAALARLAQVAHLAGRRRFVVAGGESSGAVTQALNVTRLDIGPEIAPGVPWTFAQSGEAPIALALKSGNFGGVDFFTAALDTLEASWAKLH